MAKFFGKVGYNITQKLRPGVSIPSFVEREYYGDVIRNTRRIENGNTVNDNVYISNQISIVADPFAYENFHAIRYVVYMGSKWRVSDVEVQYPRLTLSLGGVYNGDDGPEA